MIFAALSLLLIQSYASQLPETPLASRTVIFSESLDFIANPDRGFRGGVDLLNPDLAALKSLRDAGMSIAMAYVKIPEYRNRDFDPAFLNALQSGFEKMRTSGVRVIPRFTYNFGYEPDAPLNQVLRHISQLKPVIRANADVISAFQAGFIGAWGEWHSSTNGLTKVSAMKSITTALLNAIPNTIQIQFRKPKDKALVLGDGYAPSVSNYTAFDGSIYSRIGHHNDCFLATSTDAGTFPTNGLESWRSYLATDTSKTLMGGETCAVRDSTPARTSCSQAQAELQRFHFTYLNPYFYKPVIDQWRQEGCLNTITRKLGYRLVLSQAVINNTTYRIGETLSLSVSLRNFGYARMMRARSVYLVLRPKTANATSIVKKLSVDPRSWTPGKAVTISASLVIPQGMSPGEWDVALWIPDPSATLSRDSRYAVRFANQNVWSDPDGLNVLTSIQIN